jgi:hypothetical protein
MFGRTVPVARNGAATPFHPVGKLYMTFACHVHPTTDGIAPHALLCVLLSVVTMAVKRMDWFCHALHQRLLFPLTHVVPSRRSIRWGNFIWRLHVTRIPPLAALPHMVCFV